MHALSFPIVIAYSLSIAFGIVGAVQLSGFDFVHRAYERWGHSSTAIRLTGALELLSAILIANSNARPIGLALAAAVNFVAVVLLLKNREYLLAVPGLAVAPVLPLTLVLTLTH